MSVHKVLMVSVVLYASLGGRLDTVFAQSAEAWKPGIAGDFAFETGSLMKSSAYLKPLKASTDLNPSGAYGPVNRAYDTAGKQGPWYIEEQRYGYDAIAAGLSGNNTDTIQRGLKILEWGFLQQLPDGSFPCPDRFHSASFFVEAVAHSILLLEYSKYAGAYESRIAALKPKLLMAARWMTQVEIETAGKKRNAPYAHRRYLVAAALGETGVIFNDAVLLEKSLEYVREGIMLQDPSGVNPEKGGFDSSYHAVGVLFALRYYTIVASDAVREEMKPSIQHAITWLVSRIDARGVVAVTGNTRTGSSQEVGRSGKPKGISYGSIYRVLEYWALVTGDAKLHLTAQLVVAADARQR